MEVGRAGAWRHEAWECVGRRIAVSPQELTEVSEPVGWPMKGSREKEWLQVSQQGNP